MAAEKRECMIIGASPIRGGQVFKEYELEKYYVICADAGFETAQKNGVQPDLVVSISIPPRLRLPKT